MVSTIGAILIAIFVILIVAAIGWVVFVQLRARNLGLPPPSLASYNPFRKPEQTYGPPRPAAGGVVGWFNDRIRAFKNRNNRTAVGAYEGGRGGVHGSGPMDPDEAWDARVGHEADNYGPGGYYEEQELRDTHTAYDGSSYNMNLAATPGAPPAGFGDEENQRGRQMSRSPGAGLNVPRPAPAGKNPFDDDVEPSNISMRGVSPRPIDIAAAAASKGKGHESAGNSPTERRSVFRENV